MDIIFILIWLKLLVNLRKEAKTIFKELEEKLPPIIARKHIGNYFGGTISAKTLANYASLGTGPEQIKIGRNVGYLTKNLLEWLDSKYGK